MQNVSDGSDVSNQSSDNKAEAVSTAETAWAGKSEDQEELSTASFIRMKQRWSEGAMETTLLTKPQKILLQVMLNATNTIVFRRKGKLCEWLSEPALVRKAQTHTDRHMYRLREALVKAGAIKRDFTYVKGQGDPQDESGPNNARFVFLTAFLKRMETLNKRAEAEPLKKKAAKNTEDNTHTENTHTCAETAPVGCAETAPK